MFMFTLHYFSQIQGSPSPDSYKDQLIGGPHTMKGPYQHTINQRNEWPPPPPTTSDHGQPSNLPTSASNRQGLSPGQEVFVPGKQGLLPGQEGFVPGKQGLLPGQEGFVPGKQGPLAGQKGFVPGKQGLLPGQEGFVPGKQGHLPNVGGPLQKAPIITSADQPLSPGRDTMIHRYHVGGSEPANTLAYGRAGVLGSHRPSQSPAGLSPSREGSRGTLPQLSPREGGITNKEAVQAPYDAYRETLAGKTVSVY